MNATENTIIYRLGTRSGVRIDARAVKPEDATLLEDFFDKVSDADRRFRFLTPYRHVGAEQIAPLVEVDHIRVESFLAFDCETDDLIATGMLACDSNMNSAEVAISVRSDYKGKGVGWAMLDLLASEARKRGVKEVIAIEDRENHEAIALEREKGFQPRALEGDPRLVVLAKSFD